MASTLPTRDVRPPATEGRVESLPRRAVSHRARFDATAVEITADDGIDIDIVKAVMTARAVTVKEFAINAKASRSQVSEALSGAGGRNLSYAWVLRQDSGFILAVHASVEERLGLTPTAKRSVTAKRIAELVQLLVEEAS